MNKSQKSGQAVAYDDEIDLRELFRNLWAGKWIIGGITFAATVIAVIVALMLPNMYRAEALLAPNDQEGASGLSALAVQYGGLASLAGINLGGRGTDKTALGLELLKSRRFISEFIERHDILVPLVASDGWDPNADELKIDPDEYDVVADEWVRDTSFSGSPVPSPQKAYKKFMEKFSASQDSKSGFVTVSVEHYSPTVAKQWVDWLVEDINAMIMKQDVAKAEQAIAYLNEQIQKTPLADLQNVFFRLIEEQMKTVMLANVSPEYLFRTIDPAIAPEQKTRPKRSLIVILAAILGGMVGIVIVLINSKSKVRRE